MQINGKKSAYEVYGHSQYVCRRFYGELEKLSREISLEDGRKVQFFRALIGDLVDAGYYPMELVLLQETSISLTELNAMDKESKLWVESWLYELAVPSRDLKIY